MKASPLIPLLVLFVSLALGGPAVAEYPFDPMLDSGYSLPTAGPGGYDDGPLLDDGYGHDDGYGPDPFLYEDGYPPVAEIFDDEIPIWPGWVSINGQPGSDRSLWGGEWFQPLYQDGRNLWYFGLRGQGDSESGSEWNLGTGFRALLDPGWIFGSYVFVDHLNSSNDNSFTQAMIGIEVMDVFWDGRFNVYFPESGGKSVGAPRTRLSNGNVVVQGGLERAYWGFDVEVGSLLWAWGPAAQHELRGFFAIYHFDHSANGSQSITGPRARLEWRWYDLPWFGPNSRFTCGLTVQADRVRDGQALLSFELRIPLGSWRGGGRRLSPLYRRMLDRVVRDVDIVTATSH